MSKDYLVKDTTLTSLADGVRGITGGTAAITTGEMISALNDAETEVDSQADLIAQLISILDGAGVTVDDEICVGKCRFTVQPGELYNSAQVYCVSKLSSGSLIFGECLEFMGGAEVDSATIEDIPCLSVIVVDMAIPSWNCTTSKMVSIGGGYINGSYKHVLVAPANDVDTGVATFSEGTTYGGSTINTCTITLTGTSSASYTTVTDGNIDFVDRTTSQTLTNVACNSVVYVAHNYTNCSVSFGSTSMLLLDNGSGYIVFNTPSTAGNYTVSITSA